MAPRTGRPPKENPRNMNLGLRLTKEEMELIIECATKLGVTRTDAIMMGIKNLLAQKK